MKISKHIFALAFIGLMVYFNSLFNGFVWDDEEQVLNNLPVHSLANFFQFFKESTFNSGGTGNLGGLYYKPFMTTFFALIYTIFGQNSFFFHFFQLSLHIISSILLFLIFKHFLINRHLLAFVLALIFLIHPINTEAVVYISDLQDILFFFFGVLALYLSIEKTLKFSNLVLITVLLLSSLLSKETGAIFIITIGFYFILYKRRWLFQYALSAISAVGFYSLLRFGVAGIYFNKHGLSPITMMMLNERLLSIPKIIFSYLKTFVFPQNLAINQHWAVKSINWNDFIFPLIVDIIFLLILTLVGAYLLKKQTEHFKVYLFFLIWFLVGLGLHLQIFPLDLTYSDRWFYFPIAGLLGLLGLLITSLKIRVKFKPIIVCLTIIIIFCLSIRTFIRNFDWKDGLSLYSHDIGISRESFDLENNLGVELFRVNQMDKAQIHFENSIRLAPNWWTNWNNLGVIFERKQDYKKAAEYYKKAIDNGQYYLAYENLANILLFHDNPGEANNFIKDALSKLPQNSKLWFLLSISEYKLQHQEEALTAAKNAYLLNPNQQNAYLYQRLLQKLPLEI